MIVCFANCLVVNHLLPATVNVLNKGQSLLFANSSGRGAISKDIVGRRYSTEDAFEEHFPKLFMNVHVHAICSVNSLCFLHQSSSCKVTVRSRDSTAFPGTEDCARVFNGLWISKPHCTHLQHPPAFLLHLGSPDPACTDLAVQPRAMLQTQFSSRGEVQATLR